MGFELVRRSFSRNEIIDLFFMIKNNEVPKKAQVDLGNAKFFLRLEAHFVAKGRGLISKIADKTSRKKGPRRRMDLVFFEEPAKCGKKLGGREAPSFFARYGQPGPFKADLNFRIHSYIRKNLVRRGVLRTIKKKTEAGTVVDRLKDFPRRL